MIVNLIARYGQGSIEEAVMKAMIDIKGAYSLLVMTEDKLIGVRDPHGVRPLCIGKLGDAYLLSSENMCPGYSGGGIYPRCGTGGNCGHR